MQLHRAPTDNDRNGYLDIWRACGIDEELIMRPDMVNVDARLYVREGFNAAQEISKKQGIQQEKPKSVRYTGGRVEEKHCDEKEEEQEEEGKDVVVECSWTMVPRHPVNYERIYTLMEINAFLNDPRKKEMYFRYDTDHEKDWILHLAMEYRLGRSLCLIKDTGLYGESGRSVKDQNSSISSEKDTSTERERAQKAVRLWKPWLYINCTISSAEHLIGGGFGDAASLASNRDYSLICVRTGDIVQSYAFSRNVTNAAPLIEVHVSVSYILNKLGQLHMHVQMDTSAVPCTLPRVGIQLNLPLIYENLRWVGKGPHECYPDRNDSAVHALHTANLSVETLHVPYIRPGENGARSDTCWVQFATHSGNSCAASHGLRVDCDRNFCFSVQRHSTEDLTNATHTNTLKASTSSHLAVNIDPYLMGVGGDDSWSSCVNTEFELQRGKYEFNITLQTLY